MARSWRWWLAGVVAAAAAGAGIAWVAMPDTIRLPADVGSQRQPLPRQAPQPARPAPVTAPPSTAALPPDMARG